MRKSAPPDAQTTTHYTFRLRRRSAAEWCMWLIWLIVVGVFVDYAVNSMVEDERQAGILAIAIALGLLLAGVIVEVMKSVDLESTRRLPPSGDRNVDQNDESARHVS